jgi:mannose-6-phosphate isomerase-like protein (cupin superfamily)
MAPGFRLPATRLRLANRSIPPFPSVDLQSRSTPRLNPSDQLGLLCYYYSPSRKEIVMRTISIVAFVSTVFVLTPVIADAKTKLLPAAAISAAEIQALMGPRKPNTLPNIRMVDAGGHHVGVGVLYRAEGQTQNTAVHFKVSEVYHMMKGSGTLVTGGTVVNPKTRAADSIEVTREDGPGVTGTAIQGGVNHELKEGDVIIIPAGTPHWFSKINGSIVYLVVRIDPSQLIALQ